MRSAASNNRVLKMECLLEGCQRLGWPKTLHIQHRRSFAFQLHGNQLWGLAPSGPIFIRSCLPIHRKESWTCKSAKPTHPAELVHESLYIFRPLLRFSKIREPDSWREQQHMRTTLMRSVPRRPLTNHVRRISDANVAQISNHSPKQLGRPCPARPN